MKGKVLSIETETRISVAEFEKAACGDPLPSMCPHCGAAFDEGWTYSEDDCEPGVVAFCAKGHDTLIVFTDENAVAIRAAFEAAA